MLWRFAASKRREMFAHYGSWNFDKHLTHTLNKLNINTHLL